MLHTLSDVIAAPAAGIVIAVLVIAWFGVGLVAAFPQWWQVALFSVSSSATVVMVFAIQHTQTHQQLATQRKLDELIRSLPRTDERLISAEAASATELKTLSALHLDDRRRANEAAGPDAAEDDRPAAVGTPAQE